jgi:hypothetical protein
MDRGPERGLSPTRSRHDRRTSRNGAARRRRQPPAVSATAQAASDEA